MARKYKGSYTVEAAFIFPLVMSVIVLIIYLSFFIHDRAVMDAASYQAAMRGSLVTSERSDFLKKAEKAGDDLLKEALLVTRISEKNIEMKNNTLTVTYSGIMNIPGGVNFIPGIPTELRLNVKSSATRLDPTGFVRSCRIVENLKDSTEEKDMDENGNTIQTGYKS